jgi:uncharacterized membrane protein
MFRSFALGLPVFLLLDLVWLGIISRRFYADQLGPWLRRGPDGGLSPLWTPALLFYVLVVVGIVAFVAPRVATSGGGLLAAAGWGALFGAIVYAAWDLTNYSVLQGWPLAIVAVDMAWGATICAVTSIVMTIATRWRG